MNTRFLVCGVLSAFAAFAGSASERPPSARFSYDDAGRCAWDELLFRGKPEGKRQLSVHIPVGLHAVSDLLYCDCAFNAWKLPVPPDMKMGEKRSEEICAALKADRISFALGETPFVPDFRQTVWSRPYGGYPIVRGELDARYRHYTFDYCTDPAGGELYIRGTVQNTGNRKGPAVVRVRRAAPLEKDACDYHYITFRWDAERWAVGESLPAPRVAENGFDSATVEPEWSVADGKYGMGADFWGSPYYVHPSLRVRQGRGTLRFEADLAPGESRSFVISAGFAAHAPDALPTFDKVVGDAMRYWDGMLSVRADFGNERENDIYRDLQFCNLQLLLDPWGKGGASHLMPCQGGSSERFYSWVWEAMCSLRPMTRLGHASALRRVLDYILSLQDGGCPPEGDFTTLRGAIGTTGPRWANTTGAALLLAADYIRYSGDEDFRKRHLDDLIRAAKWILGETAATRRTDGEGHCIAAYGLMPGCVANDADRGVFFASTDSYSYAGVRRLVDLLGEVGHAEFGRLNAEAVRYKADIDAAIRSVQRADGFIPRVIGSDKGGSFEFRNIPHALKFISSGASDPVTDTALERMVAYWEGKRCVGPFAQPFDANIRYIGNIESCLAGYHLQRGEWKKAYFARQAFMGYALTQDLGITSERYSEVDDGFVPWQPNASNNGRGLDVMTDRFLQEGNSRLVLLGGFAPFENRDVSIHGLRTRFGRCDIVRRGGSIRVEWERELPSGVELLVPAHHQVVPVGESLKRTGGESWVVVRPTRVLQWRVGAPAEILLPTAGSASSRPIKPDCTSCRRGKLIRYNGLRTERS